jgi:nucleoid DNA-binding protein
MVAQLISHPAYAEPLPTPYNPDPVLLAIVETIREGLIRDQHVRLHNFGTFRLRWSKPRRVKHPKTGEYIIAPPAPKITFTPAKHLRERVDPEKMPAIPLIEPVSLQPESEQKTPEEENENCVQETVEDILDTEYAHSDFDGKALLPTNDHTGKHINEADADHAENKFNKKMGLGLLAAVPLILAILQADFSLQEAALAPNKNAANNSVAESTINEHDSASSEVFDHRVIRNESNEPLAANEIPQESTQPKPSSQNIAGARPEPSPRSFYMSPQLHTIEEGDSLWRLAEKFYGDALLWPHIYRANIRTISNPDSIRTGRQLVIPGLQQSPDTLSNNDKELISEGYYMAYQFSKAKHSSQAIYFLIGAKQFSFDWLASRKQEIDPNDWKVVKRRND